MNGHGSAVVLTGPATAAWEALGTTALVRVGAPEALSAAVVTLDRQLREIDRVASRFRDDSELCEVNRRAGRTTPVSPLMAELIDQALRAAELSDGIVNPALGWALTRAGYDRDFAELGVARGGNSSFVSEPVRIVAHRQDWRSIELDLNAGTVRMGPGTVLDLGATAKAYAADRAANSIASATGVGALVSLGGDIATAGPTPDGEWEVFVTDDHRSGLGAFGQRVLIESGALATSSTTVRRWRQGDAVRHHIIDPRTGAPAVERWRTVSATAQSCVDANIATTAAIVLGDEAIDWLSEAGIAARLVDRDGEVSYTCGWPVAEARS